MLIHHSRDSAKKQWAETQVITLHGTGEEDGEGGGRGGGRGEGGRGKGGRGEGGREGGGREGREGGKEGEGWEGGREGGEGRSHTTPGSHFTVSLVELYKGHVLRHQPI